MTSAIIPLRSALLLILSVRQSASAAEMAAVKSAGVSSEVAVIESRIGVRGISELARTGVQSIRAVQKGRKAKDSLARKGSRQFKCMCPEYRAFDLPGNEAWV